MLPGRRFGFIIRSGLQAAVQTNLISLLNTFDLEKQGTALTDWQEVAGEALASQIENGSPILAETFGTIHRIGQNFGGILFLPSELLEILAQASRRNELPPDLKDEFWRDLQRPAESNGPSSISGLGSPSQPVWPTTP